MANRKLRRKTEELGKELRARPLADGTASLAVGLIAAALLSSLAAAGLNTLTVARTLLFAAWGIALLLVSRSRALSGWSRQKKVCAAIALTALLTFTERVENHFQPKVRHFPQPPLMLLKRPTPLSELAKTPELTRLTTLPLALSPIARPRGGYPAFDFDNDSDQVMFGIENVIFYNRAEMPLELEAFLSVDGAEVHLRLPGDGRAKRPSGSDSIDPSDGARADSAILHRHRHVL